MGLPWSPSGTVGSQFSTLLYEQVQFSTARAGPGIPRGVVSPSSNVYRGSAPDGLPERVGALLGWAGLAPRHARQECRGFSPGARANRPEDAGVVGSYGALAQAQRRRDLAVRLSSGDEVEDLQVERREPCL